MSDKPDYFSQPDNIALPTLPPEMPQAAKQSTAKGISLGDASLNISIDTSSVDELVARLERSVAAFKAEWNR